MSNTRWKDHLWKLKITNMILYHIFMRYRIVTESYGSTNINFWIEHFLLCICIYNVCIWIIWVKHSEWLCLLQLACLLETNVICLFFLHNKFLYNLVKRTSKSHQFTICLSVLDMSRNPPKVPQFAGCCIFVSCMIVLIGINVMYYTVALSSPSSVLLFLLLMICCNS